MTMRKRLASYTQPTGNFPDLVAIHEEDDGQVSIMVRQCVSVSPGTTPKMVNATVKLKPEAWAALVAELRG